MSAISSDSPDYNLSVFRSDCVTIFGDKSVFLSITIIAVIYSALLKYAMQTKPIQ